MKIKLLLLFFAVLFVACNKEEGEPAAEIEANSGSNTISNKERQFQQVQDSILQNYASAIRLVNQIDTELNKIANAPIKNEGQTYETQIIQKIEYLSFQLKTNNENIARLEKKIKGLNSKNKELTEKIKTIESILLEKDKVIANQVDRIDKLEREIGIVIQERDFALEGKQIAEIERDKNITEKNTAYYVIGTEEELKKNNIIKMEGEGFLGIGGKWVPNAEADNDKFIKINIVNDIEFSFPANYIIEEIVSTQNKNFLSLGQNTTGSPTIKIANPDVFWRTDKRLIILINEK